MKLKDVKTIWGIEADLLKSYSKKHIVNRFFITLVNVILVVFFVYNMYVNNSSVQVYWVVMLIIVGIILLLSTLFLNMNIWSAYKFMLRYCNRNIQIKYYDVNMERLSNIAYCLGYKSKNIVCETLDDYKKLIQCACQSDKYNARKVVKLLKKYECVDSSFSLWVLEDKYFVDFNLDMEVKKEA